MSYVQIDNLTKTYKDTIALNHLSLTFEKGEFVTLLGPSGCGKSTLLRSIAGLVPVEEGSIRVDGVDITHLPPKDREIGMVFQSYALFPNMTVFENIGFGLRMKGMKKSEYEGKVKRMIELVDLTGKEQSYPHQLSGGQQQRVALARSLVMEPKILLLDEPLSALDAKIRKNLQAELRRIQRELSITTVFVTHDQEEALTISDRIFVMDQGNIVQSGNPEEIYTHPANEFVARFIGNYNVLRAEQLRQLTGDGSFAAVSYAIRPEVIQLFPEHAKPEPSGSGWLASGKVKDITVTGNVLRYLVESQDQWLQVDHLNTAKELWIQRDMNVNVWIPAEECVPLG